MANEIKGRGQILAEVFQLKEDELMTEKLEEMIYLQDNALGVLARIRKAMHEYARQFEKKPK